MSSSVTDGLPSRSYSAFTAWTSVRCSTDQSSIEAWPLESTKRSRLGQIGILRVEMHDPVPNRVNQRRQRHRRAGMAGFGRLHRIDRKRADGVDGQLVRFWSLMVIFLLLLTFMAGFQRRHFAQPAQVPLRPG